VTPFYLSGGRIFREGLVACLPFSGVMVRPSVSLAVLRLGSDPPDLSTPMAVRAKFTAFYGSALWGRRKPIGTTSPRRSSWW
jgi:hypothetical protein